MKKITKLALTSSALFLSLFRWPTRDGCGCRSHGDCHRNGKRRGRVHGHQLAFGFRSVRSLFAQSQRRGGSADLYLHQLHHGHDWARITSGPAP